VPAIALCLALVGCGDTHGVDPALGPMTYDASGTLPCSAGSPSFDAACGWRLVRKGGGGSEIWISNIATTDEVTFRVLDFAQDEFIARDGTPLTVRKSGEIWEVSVPGREYYRISAEVMGAA